MMEEKKTNISKPAVFAAALLAAVILAVGAFMILSKPKETEESTPIITKASLQKIINVSELSTSTAVYNGIAKVQNEKKPVKIDYYVSYEATVSAGISFSDVDLIVDENAKTITVLVPEAHITSIDVDIASMDFIFDDKKANASTVTQQAFKACEADVKEESAQQGAITELAQQNAVNVLTALIKPFVEELDAEYTLTVR